MEAIKRCLIDVNVSKILIGSNDVSYIFVAWIHNAGRVSGFPDSYGADDLSTDNDKVIIPVPTNPL